MKELTMTVICVCGNQFGSWRPRCPACGTDTPQAKREEPVMNTPRVVRERHRQNECVFCHKGKAKDVCPHCNEPIHHGCKTRLHLEACAAFQVERNAELAKVSA